jgi:hypothetical protein
VRLTAHAGFGGRLQDIQGSMHAGRRQRVADGGQTPVPWRLSRSVIDSVGPAGVEFARNADYLPIAIAAPLRASGTQNIQFWVPASSTRRAAGGRTMFRAHAGDSA